METATFGTSDDPDLVFVLGWGNRIDHENVQWLIDLLADGGYHTHVCQIPLNGTDFQRDYLDPVREYVADLDEYRLLGHSTGGLIGAHLRDREPITRTYLSPWWGFPPEQEGLALSLVTKLPISAQVIPSGVGEADVLGELVTDRQIAEGPDKASPAFLGMARRAQADLPPFDPEAVVFYTPDDGLVSAPAIEQRTPERNRIAYDGGHELFSSAVREDYRDRILAAVERGIGGIRDEN